MSTTLYVPVERRALEIAEVELGIAIEAMQAEIDGARSSTSARCLRWKQELKDLKWSRAQIRKSLEETP